MVENNLAPKSTKGSCQNQDVTRTSGKCPLRPSPSISANVAVPGNNMVICEKIKSGPSNNDQNTPKIHVNTFLNVFRFF